MKKKLLMIMLLVMGFVMSFQSVQAAEVTFNPNVHFYDMNGNGTLSLWGVPAANGNAIKANPDNNYPTEASIASWLAMIMKAQELNLVVVIGYDPNTLDIWYIGRPR